TGALVGVLGPANLVLLSAVLLEVAAQCATRLARRARTRAEPVGGGILAGFARTVKSGDLLGFVGQTLLYTATSTFLYLLQQNIVAHEMPDKTERTRFFSWRDTAVNVGTAVVQFGATGRIVTRLGIAVALAATPILTALAFGAAWLAPTLLVV